MQICIIILLLIDHSHHRFSKFLNILMGSSEQEQGSTGSSVDHLEM